VTGGEICKAANSVCTVLVERGYLTSLLDSKAPYVCAKGIGGIDTKKNNCSCLDPSLTSVWPQLLDKEADVYDGVNGHYDWKEARQNICRQLGDCGDKVNFIGNSGYPQSDIQVITNLTE
jgi:hypothetical protein